MAGIVEDSHYVLPEDHRSLAELQSCDLIPYKNLADKLGGIMTAHVQFPNIEEALATFSKYWINTILREQIGFQGLVFSDDLTMKGAHAAGNPLQRCQQALKAGCDMALICNDPEAAMDVARKLQNPITTSQQRLESMRCVVAESKIEISHLKEKVAQISETIV